MHKGPCGLEFCPLKDAGWGSKAEWTPAKKENKQTISSKVTEQQMLWTTMTASDGTNTPQQQKKNAKHQSDIETSQCPKH
jgi:hypothetical protein